MPLTNPLMAFVAGQKSAAGSGGTTNYAELTNKPSVNGVELSGDRRAEDLGLVAAAAGKGLSENDFTDVLKDKLDNIPANATDNIGTVTSITISGTDPIIVSDSAAVTSSGVRVISHADSGVTAGSKGDITNQAPAFGGTFKVLSATVDAKGHLTALNDHAVELPSNTATPETDGLMSKADKAKLDNSVTGVKGKAESAYRTGNVNLTPENIGAVPLSKVGTANGVAELDANGKVPSAQLPAYVDDVLEYASLSAFPATGESGKIYVSIDTNLSYRWTGSAYVEISPSVALGETSSTAYRGDRGKIAYDHSQTTGNAHNMTKSDIGLGNVPNVATNDQTPTYTAASALAALTSGEKLSVAFGKIAKGVSELIAHLADNVKHITAAERTAWNNKVDKAAGKGLSTNDYTTAEKQKLEGIEAEAQVNEVSAEQYATALGNITYLSKENQSLRKTLNNLIAGLSVPLTITANGTKGYLMIEDAAAGSVSALTVDPSLSGTTLYVQIHNVTANTFQSASATVSGTGNVPVSGLTVAYGTNQIYVAKTAYVWNNKMSTSIGADHFPTNGVDFAVTYSRDKNLGLEVDKGFLTWDDFLEICGYKVTRTGYASTAAAIAGFNNGEVVVIKSEWPHDTYGDYCKISNVPAPTSTLTYYRETYALAA